MDWKEARQLTEKVLQLKARLDNPQENENLDEIAIEYNELRQKLLEEMKACPNGFYKGDVERIFTNEELVAEGLLSSRKRIDHSQLPDLNQFFAYPNYEAKENCTDVYFLGIDGSGRACLLMGLIGTEGTGYSIDFRSKGGPFASALKLYLNAGVVPCSTPNSFATTINCIIEETCKDNISREGMVLKHVVNFVRMGGGELDAIVGGYRSDGFHHSRVQVDSSKLTDLGYGTGMLLRNTNRKVFFIVVNPTFDGYNSSYYEGEHDAAGNGVGVCLVKSYIDQEDSINKLMDLITLDENKELMKQVDAIHFIVTCADTMGKSQEERNRKAHALLIGKYRGAVNKLVAYCRRNRHINRTTDFQPRIFTFSLGKFYLDGYYEYDSKDSLYLIDALRHMTQGTKESAGLGRLFGHASTVVQPTLGDYGIKINMDE